MTFPTAPTRRLASASSSTRSTTIPSVRIAAHLGDVKNGSTTCSDERFSAIADAVDRFEDPVIYTPGDNEWTDCHRTNNGAYNPLERLDTIRSIFFAQPG